MLRHGAASESFHRQPAVADINSYIENGNSSPVLGSDIRAPEECARPYDEDVKQQAEQFGLEGW